VRQNKHRNDGSVQGIFVADYILPNGVFQYLYSHVVYRHTVVVLYFRRWNNIFESIGVRIWFVFVTVSIEAVTTIAYYASVYPWSFLDGKIT